MTAIEQLMYLQGVALDYRDYDGTLRRIPDSTRRAILTVCGHDIDAEAAIERSNFLLDAAPWQQLLPTTLFTSADAPQLSIRLPIARQTDSVSWSLFSSDDVPGSANTPVATGTVTAGSQAETGRYQIADVLYLERSWHIATLQPGYYRYVVKLGSEQAETLLIASPDKTYNPYPEERLWGLSTQVYSLRSERNYGIGDFGDLAHLVSISAAAGADFVLMSPLHALFPHAPERASPYSPSDRFLLNPIYIHPDQCIDFSANPAIAERLNAEPFAQQLQALRQADWIDYSAVFALKYELYALMFAYFSEHELNTGSARDVAFTAFCQQAAAELSTHALWLQECASGLGTSAGEPSQTFVYYLQWLAWQQLQEVQQLADKSAMKLGLIRDLAVGCVGDGSEASRYPALFVNGASIGAPPDPLGPQGQNWGLPPQNPVQIKADKFGHFRRLIAANMRNCGALRIDHVMGLLRLWWCIETTTDSNAAVEGAGANEPLGCYVYYPFEQLLAILKLESVLNRCVVIGEDLGIVPEPVKQAMSTAQIYSNLLFYFEQDHQGRFRPLAHLNPRALLMIANHDVPPFPCWWRSEDLQTRRDLGLFNSEQDYQAAMQHRQRDKEALRQWLQDYYQGQHPSEYQGQQPENEQHPLAPLPLFKQLAVALAASPVSLFALQLEDFDEQPAPVNIPGTHLEYPNWRRRLRLPLEALLADHDFFARLEQARQTPC